MHKWLSRVWRLTLEHLADQADRGSEDAAAGLRKAAHEAIAGVSADFEDKKYNTAIAKLMTLTNEVNDARRNGVRGVVVDEAVTALLTMLAPICPFITEELWQRMGRDGSIHDQIWPQADATLLVEEETPVIVQINGKVRGKVVVPTDADQAAVEDAARTDENVTRHLEGVEIVKVIHVPNRLINFVVKG
jgi:leucyl-tRNA synthetase